MAPPKHGSWQTGAYARTPCQTTVAAFPQRDCSLLRIGTVGTVPCEPGEMLGEPNGQIH